MSFTLTHLQSSSIFVLDSYVTLEEVTTYLTGDDRATAFLTLTDQQKTSYLNRATLAIDAAPFRGTKYDLGITAGVPDQKRAFPRIIDGVTLDYNSTIGLPIVPPDVKTACIEEVLAIQQAGTGGRKLLQDQGVKSFVIGGKLSETFIDGAGNRGLLSATSKLLLRKYMGTRIR
jgi:hypothetical protein